MSFDRMLGGRITVRSGGGPYGFHVRLRLYARYQRTHSSVTGRSKCLPLNTRPSARKMREQ